MTPLLIAQILLTLFVFVMLLNSAAIMVYVEREGAALPATQGGGAGTRRRRWVPSGVGTKVLLQPLADIIKLMFKEELRPRAADPLLFALAPIIAATAALAACPPGAVGAAATG